MTKKKYPNVGDVGLGDIEFGDVEFVYFSFIGFIFTHFCVDNLGFIRFIGHPQDYCEKP